MQKREEATCAGEPEHFRSVKADYGAIYKIWTGWDEKLDDAPRDHGGRAAAEAVLPRASPPETARRVPEIVKICLICRTLTLACVPAVLC
jgi:hypothetical protein